MIHPVPNPFPNVNVYAIPKGTILHRLHSRRFGPVEFNPGRGAPTRFAPLVNSTGPVPTAYVAEDLESAIFETILHDVVPGVNASIDWSRIENVDHSILRVLTPIMVARLHAPDLAALGLTRADLIDTAPTEYLKTGAWALGLHGSQAHLSGMRWTSRLSDPKWAGILFGDRLDLSADVELVDRTPLRDCNDRLDRVRLACARIRAFVSF
jgi:hypothetical protein